ncbi:MAG: peptidase domain-containing ABC transporter [Phycisphaerae bacterium]|nr:peptidase domain-containing ABC transporter [Saprospiraceae bacterium]
MHKSFSFPFFRQRDAMDCGPSCLWMIAAAHGRQYPLTYLRERSYLSREGVSALGIMEAAEAIGFRAMTVKVPFDTGEDTACLLNAPVPCIAHWNQQHFVVIYKVNHRFIWVADPAAGKFKLARKDFEKSWLSDTDQGILILLEPTPKFYQHDSVPSEKKARLGTLLEYVRPHRRLISQLLIGMALGSLLMLIFPLLTQSIVDFGIDNRNVGFIYLVLLAQVMLFLSQIVVQFLQSRILLFIGTRINVSMVSDFLAKLMRLPIGFFDTKMTGDLMQRIGDQGRIEAFLTHSALPVIFSAFNFVVFSAILLLYNVTIFGVFALAAVLYITWIAFFLRRRKELDYTRFRQASENNNTLIELIQGMQEIKLQGSERKRRWIWAGIQAQLFHTSLRSLNLAQWQEAGAGFINQSKNIIITFLAAKSVIDGQMTLGMMLATQYMVGQLDAPLQQFITFIRSAQDAKISLERMNEIHEVQDEGASTLHAFAQRTSSPTEGDPQRAAIHIENLSFRYNALFDDVLTDINLSIPQSKITAIVGTSGSGKTTLLKLLLGFYQPTKGNISIGNTPLTSINPAEWRKSCGTVMQDGFIFSDTIANNIAECDDHPDAAKLVHAVDMGNIRSFIDELPLGYNTKIGTQGNGISQGQRQRMLIARAVYKNPDYLFFDEATNALDANNERAIVENLQSFYREPSLKREGGAGAAKTVVIVAHRLSTVRHADQIVVLEKGNIVEQGTHDELVARRGAYFDLVKNQLELGA